MANKLYNEVVELITTSTKKDYTYLSDWIREDYTYLIDWIEEGDTDNMSPAEIAKEWDRLPE